MRDQSSSQKDLIEVNTQHRSCYQLETLLNLSDNMTNKEQELTTEEKEVHGFPVGMRVVKEVDTIKISEISTGQCPVKDRWKTMPKLDAHAAFLTRLDLTNCPYLVHMDGVEHLTELRHLNLTRCEQLTRLPAAIGNLRHLEILDLTDCAELRELPDSIGNLKSLKRLSLGGHDGSGNKVLESLPESLGDCQSLEELNLEKCKGLQRLPESIGRLTHLTFVNMRENKGVTQLPESMVNCPLTRLILSKCVALTALPLHLPQWKQLEELILTKCKGLTSLPDNIGQLTSLEYLDLRACKNLTQLPDSLGNLRQLGRLDLSACKKLQSLPTSLAQLSPTLVRLNLSNCPALTEFPATALEPIRGVVIGWDDLVQTASSAQDS